MSVKKKNLSDHKSDDVPSAKGMSIAIVVSEWNAEITEALYQGCYKTLVEYGCEKKNILRRNVPGSFELPLGALLLAEHHKPDAVICLGCVIQGETRHFDFICQAVATGIMQLNLEYQMPFIFGVLTPDTMQQAIERAGGLHGNKGVEAAVTAIKMADLKKRSRKK